MIDTSTGTVKMRAQFANGSGSLFPNQFCSPVRMLVDTLAGATVVPSAAIQQGAPGSFVYLIKADQGKSAQTVSVTPVKLGPATEEERGDQRRLEARRRSRHPGRGPAQGRRDRGCHRRDRGDRGGGPASRAPPRARARPPRVEGSATAAWTAGGADGGAGGWAGHEPRSGTASWVDGGVEDGEQSGAQSPHRHHRRQSDDQGQGQ